MKRVSPRQVRHLLVGGLVAMGLDDSHEYLLTVSHSGRALFSTRTWDRIARDYTVVYPSGGRCTGIGPLAGRSIVVLERDEVTDAIRIRSDVFDLLGESDGVTVTFDA
jgi:hypothetical protein